MTFTLALPSIQGIPSPIRSCSAGHIGEIECGDVLGRVLRHFASPVDINPFVQLMEGHMVEGLVGQRDGKAQKGILVLGIQLEGIAKSRDGPRV